MTSTGHYTSKIEQLWHSSDAPEWQHALSRYWDCVSKEHVAIEREMDALRPDDVRHLDADQWYDWLLHKYYFWKYTAPNRYATTTMRLKRQVTAAGRHHLLTIRDQVLDCENARIKDALRAARQLGGLGPAGASGLLALLFPTRFGTVDQFVVRALQKVRCLPERGQLERMKNPESLTDSHSVVLVKIMRRKAASLNERLHTSGWTPRKIDKVLWANDRG
ncbi:MAG: hypothetical protein OXC55_02750 [Chloroflexi bacterium]|nr:hypothetical protein [Chloroflexota bacterium]